MAAGIMLPRISPDAVSGPEIVGTLEAPDGESATRVALLVRPCGHGNTETRVATPRDRFVQPAKDASN